MSYDVEILSVATANPKNLVDQKIVVELAKLGRPDQGFISELYENTCIDSRYFCESLDWCITGHGWEERTQLYQRHAVDLLEEVTLKIVADAGIAMRDIDAIVTNTITGLAVPGLDIKLANRLDFRPNIERLPMFGFGCGGGIGGLARATQLTHGMKDAHVLFLTVDLCSLCTRIDDISARMSIASAIFGDGAAGVLLRNTSGSSHARSNHTAKIRAVGERFWRDSEYIMGWDFKDDGFHLVLSPELNGVMEVELAPAIHEFLARHDVEFDEIKGFLIHPGGAKLLVTMQQVLGIDRSMLDHSWEVMRQYGNMSSVTVLFVLERAMRAGATGPHLLGAFGPGFSAYFAIADL